MKVFGKWLVMAKVDTVAPRVAASFMTKKEAVQALDKAFKSKLSKYIWVDSFGQMFWIQKNVKEYK